MFYRLCSVPVSRILCAVLFAVAVGSLGTARAEDRFRLQVPGEPAEKASTVVRDDGQLVIEDARGKTYRYVRAPRFDAPDGDYTGWYSPAVQQALRWPASDRGNMQIGDQSGRRWKVSQMRILPLRRAARPVTPDRPVPGFDRNEPRRNDPRIPRRPQNSPIEDLLRGRAQPRPHRGHHPQHRGLSVSPAVAPLGGNQLLAGYIDNEGRLRLMQGRTDRWRPLRQTWDGRLEPGGVLRFYSPDLPGDPEQPQPERLRDPIAFTVAPDGNLLGIRVDGTAERVTDSGRFVPGGHFALSGTLRPIAVLVDRDGQPVAVNLASGRETSIDDFRDDRLELQPGRRGAADNRGRGPFQPGRGAGQENPGRGPRDLALRPGSPVAAGEGSSTRMFVIDRRGELQQYTRDRGQWSGPRLVARGFIPGTPISMVTRSSGRERDMTLLAAVNAGGQAVVIAGDEPNWRVISGPDVTFPARSAVELFDSGRVLSLSGVSRRGRWQVWSLVQNSQWDRQVIASGFPAGAAVAFSPHSLTGFCADLTGRLVCGYPSRSGWEAVVCRPGPDLSPRLVRRSMIAGGAAGLPPVEVLFDNPSAEAIIVRLYDRDQGQQVAELKIPAGGAVSRVLERDGGQVLEEVWLIPGPGGQLVEDVHRHTLPARIRYDVVVFADRTTYQYIDRRQRKPAGALPDFSLNSLVSLGAFPLPAGRGLQQGDRINVPREAALRENPGAPVLFP